MSNPAPGWYPAPHANGEQRYWDGAQWHEQQQQPPFDYPSRVATALKPARGLAIAALVVGIAAFLSGLLPIVGTLIALAGLALGVMALVQKQSKGMAITGLAMSGLALLTSIAITAGVAAYLPNARPLPVAAQSAETEILPSASPNPTPTPSPEEPEPTPGPESEPEKTEAAAPPAPAPPASTTPDLATFYPTDDRSWALVAKDPDSYSGTNIILYGSIMQFDSATGRCAMLIDTAASQQEYSFDYDTSIMAISGDADTKCPVFDPLVEDDNVKIWATIDSSFSYDTQIGGNTTVPLLEVWYAELLPATEY